MSEIAALIGFYQDRIAAERLLKNLDQYDIESFWCDSRVEGFHQYNNSDYSTDGLQEIIQSYRNTHLYSLGLSKHGQSMNLLLKQASNYKYTITLGCDEYLEGDLNIFEDALDRFDFKEPMKLRLPITEHGSGKSHGGRIAERIVYLPRYVFLKDVHYVYFHNYFGYDKPMGSTHWQSPLVLGLTIHHDDTIRDELRNTRMDEYQEAQKKREFEALISMIKANQI